MTDSESRNQLRPLNEWDPWDREGLLPRDDANVSLWGAPIDLGGLELHRWWTLPRDFRAVKNAGLFIRHPLRENRALLVWWGDIARHMTLRHLHSYEGTVYILYERDWRPPLGPSVDDPFRPSLIYVQNWHVVRIEDGQWVWADRKQEGYAHLDEWRAIDDYMRRGWHIPVCCPDLEDPEIARKAAAFRRDRMQEREAMIAATYERLVAQWSGASPANDASG